MPIRVPTISTVVIREHADTKKNVRVEVKHGLPFNFTTAEIDDLNRIHPGALRKPVNESAVVADAGEARGTVEGGEAPKKAAGKAKTDKAKAPTKPIETETGDEVETDTETADEDEDI